MKFLQKYCFYIVLATFYLMQLFGSPSALGSGLDSLLTLFPQKKLVQEFVADGTGHRFSIAKAFQANHVYGSIGGALPLLESPIVAQGIQASIGVSVSTQFHPGQNIAVTSTEFFVDYAIIDIIWSDNLFSRFVMGHTSHHLGDNAFEELQKTKPVDYSRDYVEGFAGYTADGLRIYAGANYGFGFVVNRSIQRRWMFEAGVEAALVHLGPGLVGYGALDVKLKQELQYGSTIRYQGGVQFQNGTDRLFRLALTHQTGLEDRGQFHGQRVAVTTFGLIIEF